jgi:hypothetical protein
MGEDVEGDEPKLLDHACLLACSLE